MWSELYMDETPFKSKSTHTIVNGRRMSRDRKSDTSSNSGSQNGRRVVEKHQLILDAADIDTRAYAQSVHTDVLFVHTITVGPMAFAGSKLRTLQLPYGTTMINSCAFASCRDLMMVSLPDSVVEIGESAFEDTAIVTVDLPLHLREVRGRTFYNCKNLMHAKFGQYIVYVHPTAFEHTQIVT